MKRLIELDGVPEVEQAMCLPNAAWAPENDNLDARVEALSIRHFGRTAAQTEFEHPERFWDLYDDDDPYEDEGEPALSEDRRYVHDQLTAAHEWDLHFDALELPFEQQAPLWQALGWDVTGDDGKPLRCLNSFNRQLLAHIKGLPLLGEDLPDTAAESWGSRLADEARRFASKK